MTGPPHAQSILVVDDDVSALDGLTELLETHGYQVRQAQNGQEALEAAKRSPALALILLDLSMPLMDGWGFHAGGVSNRRSPIFQCCDYFTSIGGSGWSRSTHHQACGPR
jgi:PleD family two-component response regulator